MCVLVVSSMPSAHAKQFSRIWRKLLLHTRAYAPLRSGLHIFIAYMRPTTTSVVGCRSTHTATTETYVQSRENCSFETSAHALKIIFLNFNYYFSLCVRDVYSLMLPRVGGGGGTHDLRISHIEKSHTSAGRGEMRLRVCSAIRTRTLMSNATSYICAVCAVRVRV